MRLQEAVDRLRRRDHMPLFGLSISDVELDRALRATTPEELFAGSDIRDPHMAAAAVAGLHLWNDNFIASHNLCQGIHTPTGSYWHALCHRREGHEGQALASNLSNSRYWFRQTGEHPAFVTVYRTAISVLENAGTGFRWATEAAGQLHARHKWDPGMLLDWIAQVEDGTLSVQTQALIEEIQWREIDLLVNWCAEAALRT